MKSVNQTPVENWEKGQAIKEIKIAAWDEEHPEEES